MRQRLLPKAVTAVINGHSGIAGEDMWASEQEFETRQYMVSSDFEFFHNKNETLLEVPYHNHDFYEIYLFLSGEVTYIIEGKSYQLRPGDIILINNKELHRPSIKLGVPYERIVIWVSPNFIKSLSILGENLSMCFESTSKNRYNLLRPNPQILAYINEIVSRIEYVCSQLSYGSTILKNIYMTELIVYLNRAYLNTNIEDIKVDISYNNKINSIVRYINENLGGDLSLDKLSTKFFMSKYHLLREFTKFTGYTIHRFIQKKRLILAKSLLNESAQITEVCMQCGFSDYSNFLRSFKKEYGISPKKYAQGPLATHL
jgi:AraC-like DNA-binding protein/mannose-6-phosphate isomerase-like protein (cupin superfamily)